MANLKKEVLSLISRFDAAQEAFSANSVELKKISRKHKKELKAAKAEAKAARIEAEALRVGVLTVEQHLEGETSDEAKKLLRVISQLKLKIKNYFSAVQHILDCLTKITSTLSKADWFSYPIFISQRKQIDLKVSRKKVQDSLSRYPIISPLLLTSRLSFLHNVVNNKPHRGYRST